MAEVFLEEKKRAAPTGFREIAPWLQVQPQKIIAPKEDKEAYLVLRKSVSDTLGLCLNKDPVPAVGSVRDLKFGKISCRKEEGGSIMSAQVDVKSASNLTGNATIVTTDQKISVFLTLGQNLTVYEHEKGSHQLIVSRGLA